MKNLKSIFVVVVICLSFVVQADQLTLDEVSDEGYIFLMRHALAPGTGDPSEFALDDCSTQRNLNDKGRLQATETGEYFRHAGIEFQSVYTSEWCRCVETAELMDMGPVKPLPVINSFFQQMQLRDERTEALQLWLKSQQIQKPLLLVTHQVNITALTGVYPSSGEVVFGRMIGGSFEVAGKIDPR